MQCSLCPSDIWIGTMYRVRPESEVMLGKGYICSACREAVLRAQSTFIKEPMCECGKLTASLCEARIDKENCGNPLSSDCTGVER